MTFVFHVIPCSHVVPYLIRIAAVSRYATLWKQSPKTGYTSVLLGVYSLF